MVTTSWGKYPGPDPLLRICFDQVAAHQSSLNQVCSHIFFSWTLNEERYHQKDDKVSNRDLQLHINIIIQPKSLQAETLHIHISEQ